MDNSDEKQEITISNIMMFCIICLFTVFFVLFLTTITGLDTAIVGVVTDSTFSDETACTSADLEVENAQATELRGGIFDIEEINKPVLRVLIPTVSTEKEYLILEYEVISDGGETLEETRRAVPIYENSHIIDIEIDEQQQTFAETMRVESVGCSDNRYHLYKEGLTES